MPIRNSSVMDRTIASQHPARKEALA